MGAKCCHHSLLLCTILRCRLTQRLPPVLLCVLQPVLLLCRWRQTAAAATPVSQRCCPPVDADLRFWSRWQGFQIMVLAHIPAVRCGRRDANLSRAACATHRRAALVLLHFSRLLAGPPSSKQLICSCQPYTCAARGGIIGAVQAACGAP